MIRIWRFEDAPQEYRDLSPHGGDEDHVMHVPTEWNHYWPEASHLEGGGFGCCSVSEHELPDGSRVFIGAHA